MAETKKDIDAKTKAPAVKKETAAKAPAAKKETAAKAPAVKKETAAKAPVENKTESATKASAPIAEKPKKATKSSSVANRLKINYVKTVVPALKKHFSYKNINQVPKIEKVIINAGLGDVKDNAKSFQLAVDELKLIAGQKPLVTVAKKSVANFKVREGMTIGAKVTLRGTRMYEFLDKLISIALPRVRDFRGINPNSFDGRGNYSMGVKEQLVFPEITYDQIEKTRGYDITIVTTANSDEEAREMLKLIGFPFREN